MASKKASLLVYNGTQDFFFRPCQSTGMESSKACKFYVQRKKRYCKMLVKDGQQYCGQHLVEEIAE
ncbi:hypothetical protein SK128_021882, partial [Halocaridina rubra]